MSDQQPATTPPTDELAALTAERDAALARAEAAEAEVKRLRAALEAIRALPCCCGVRYTTPWAPTRPKR